MIKWFTNLFKKDTSKPYIGFFCDKEVDNLRYLNLQHEERVNELEREFEIFDTIENAFQRRCRVRVKHWKIRNTE